jgi:hypothetical protein
MKFCHSPAWLISIGLGASVSAFGAPLGDQPVTRYREVLDYAQGSSCSSGACSGFSAQRNDGNGVLSGAVSSYFFTGTTLFVINCEGPEYADSVSVNRGNGATTVNATLDPSAPSCTGNYGSTLQLSVTGAPDGSYNSTVSGSGKTEVPGSIERFDHTDVTFIESVTGTNGFISGVIPGSAISKRNTNTTKPK